MTVNYSPAQSANVKINWTKEWMVGAGFSFVCAVGAVHAGTDGVEAGSLTAHIRELVVLGGLAMAMICFYAGVVAAVGNVLDKMRERAETEPEGHMKRAHLSAVKFVKIFLP